MSNSTTIKRGLICAIVVVVVGVCLVVALAIRHLNSAPKLSSEEYGKLLASEVQKAKERFDALKAVESSAPFVSEFLGIFPNSKVGFSYFTDTGEPGFDVQVGLHGRYEPGMQLPVQFDSENRVIGYGEPKFWVLEVSHVTKGPSGIPGAAFNPAGERSFGAREWRMIAESGGDFSAIGYVMQTNQPVDGFQEYRSHP